MRAARLTKPADDHPVLRSTLPPPPGAWTRVARCADPHLPEVVRRAFVADEATAHDAELEAVCRACPARVACTSYADAAGVTVGVWGRRRTRADARRAGPVLVEG